MLHGRRRQRLLGGQQRRAEGFPIQAVLARHAQFVAVLCKAVAERSLHSRRLAHPADQHDRAGAASRLQQVEDVLADSIKESGKNLLPVLPLVGKVGQIGLQDDLASPRQSSGMFHVRAERAGLLDG